MLMLTAADQLKLDVVLRVLSGKITRPQARMLLNVSKSTLKRYLKHYQSKGPVFVKHGNSGKKPKHALPSELKLQVHRIFVNTWFDCNVTQFHEKLLEEKISVGRETLRKWCHDWKMVKRSKRRRRKARFYRERMPQEGLLIQFDGSHHAWFAGKKSVLIAAIDDATGEIPYAEFFESEDTFSCMKVIEKIVEKKGTFQTLYTDRAGVYGGSKRQNFAQLKRACEELGIQVFYAQSPEAKGRVERLFQTLQDRLCVELRVRKIQTLEEANNYLPEFLTKQYADRFIKPPENPESAYQPLTGPLDLGQIFCMKDYRRIYNDHTITYGSQSFQLRPKDGISIAGHEVEIREYRNQHWKAFYRGEEMPLTVVKKSNYSPWARR